MDYLQKIIEDIETHSVEGIKECFAHGVDPNVHFKGEPLINELTSEYARGPRFKECVKAFVDHGLVFEDRTLLAVLSDNASDLDSELKKDPGAIEKKYTLRCAYTPLFEASLLHICAEFNHLNLLLCLNCFKAIKSITFLKVLAKSDSLSKTIQTGKD